MRRRVFTKSPVRENRTPGSVRGLSGNWQSYRDLRGKPISSLRTAPLRTNDIRSFNPCASVFICGPYPKTSCDVVAPATYTNRIFQIRDSDCVQPTCKL